MPPVEQKTDVVPEAFPNISDDAPSQVTTTFADTASSPHIPCEKDCSELDLEDVNQSVLEDNTETEGTMTPRQNNVDEDAIGAALMSQLSLLDAVSTNSGING